MKIVGERQSWKRKGKFSRDYFHSEKTNRNKIEKSLFNSKQNYVVIKIRSFYFRGCAIREIRPGYLSKPSLDFKIFTHTGQENYFNTWASLEQEFAETLCTSALKSARLSNNQLQHWEPRQEGFSFNPTLQSLLIFYK